MGRLALRGRGAATPRDMRTAPAMAAPGMTWLRGPAMEFGSARHPWLRGPQRPRFPRKGMAPVLYSSAPRLPVPSFLDRRAS